MKSIWEEKDQQSELRDAFIIFDKDQNGFLTVEQLKNAVSNYGEKLDEE